MNKYWSTRIVFVTTILIQAHCIFAQSTPTNVELAKKEGELLLYASTRPEDANQIVGAFMKKYPFIKIQYYRAGSDPLFQRIITESRAGQRLFDVVSIKAPIMISLKERGLLAAYRSVHQSVYGPAVAREGYNGYPRPLDSLVRQRGLCHKPG